MEGIPSYRRTVPRPVARELRQEAGFGCAKCGHPYIEYHHIVPWAVEQHFRPKDMLALCGNCHPAVSKLEPHDQYAIKSNPHNISNPSISASIFSKYKEIIIEAGSNTFIDPKSIIKYCDTDILAIRGGENGVEVDLTILDEGLNQLLVIRSNEVLFRFDDLWDFEYSHNRIVARYAPREIAVDLDFREEIVRLSGNIRVGDRIISISETEFSGFGINAKNSIFMGSGTIVQVGDKSIPLPMRCKI